MHKNKTEKKLSLIKSNSNILNRERLKIIK